MQVADLDAGEPLVGSPNVVLTHHPGQAGQRRQTGELLKDHVRKYHPRDVEFTRAKRHHFPVQHRHRMEVAVQHVAHSGVAPEQHRLAGRRFLWPVVLQPLERALQQR